MALYRGSCETCALAGVQTSAQLFKDAKPLDVDDEQLKRKRKKFEETDDKDRRTAEKGMDRIYVDAGKADGFYAGNLIEMLNKNVHGARVDVGRIDLLPTYSLFDVKQADARRVVDALRGADFYGRRLYAEIAAEGKDYTRASGRKKSTGKKTSTRR